MSSSYCEAPDCAEQAVRGPWCWSHLKQKQRHPDQPLKPIAKSLTLAEKDMEISIALAEADTDGEFARLKRAQNAVRKEIAREERARIIRAAMKKAKREGAQFGPQPKLDGLEVLQRLAELGTVIATARAFGVSRITIWRALRSVSRSIHLKHRAVGPREGG